MSGTRSWIGRTAALALTPLIAGGCFAQAATPGGGGGSGAAGGSGGAAAAERVDEMVMDNGAVELTVSGPLGRIMRFGPSGGENLMWVNEAAVPADGQPAKPGYVHRGGDKVWVTQ